MYFLKNKLVILIITILLAITVTASFKNGQDNGTGVKLAIKEDLIESFKHKIIPEILPKLNNLTISDQEFSLNLKITKLNLALKNIMLSLNSTEITDENFQVTFIDPNKLILDISGIKGFINFDDSISLGFLKEKSKFSGNVNSLAIKIELTLDQIESKQSKGKMLPLITIENISVNLDFDYNLQGDWLIKIANSNLIKGLIKKIIKGQINKILSGTLKKTINQMIANTIANLSLPQIIDGKTLALDYEIISSPKILNGKFLSINSKALLLNTDIPKSLNPPFNLTDDIPDFEDSGKTLELMLSEYTINSALYTIWLSGFLKATIDNSIIPNEIPVKLNTTTLDIIFNGISDKYGIDVPVEINIVVADNPNVKFAKDNVDLKSNFECKIFVLTNETVKEQAYWFKFTMIGGAKFSLSENGSANVNANYLKIENSQMIETTVEDSNIQNLENWVNFASNVGLSYINKMYLNDLKFKIPVIKGVDLNNSTLVVKDNYMDLHVTPDINDLKFLN